MRINVEDLEPADDYLLMEFDGLPFTGTAFEENGGCVISEAAYVEGKRTGVSKIWSKSGLLLKKEEMYLDVFHGVVEEWNEDGVKTREALFELGIRLADRQWSANGDLQADFSLSEGDPQFLILEGLRERFKRS